MNEVNRSPPPPRAVSELSLPLAKHSPTSSAATSLWRRLMRKLSYRHLARLFTNADTSALIDALHRLLVAHHGACVAEKVMRGLLKVVAKLAVVVGTGELSAHQRRLLIEMDRQFHRLTLTLLSFHRVHYTYDYGFLLGEFIALKRPVMDLIHPGGEDKGAPSATATAVVAAATKWVRRTEFVFEHLSGKAFLNGVLGEAGCAAGDAAGETLVSVFFHDLERFMSSSF